MHLAVDNSERTNRSDVAALNSTSSHQNNGTRVSVLAIDDNEEFRNLVKELLDPVGFNVQTVGNPVKALELFTREKDSFQLVLLDYYMPQLDGAKTFEFLKKMNPNVKVIIVSGAEELRLRQILTRHTIDGYIRKPFRLQEALLIIRHVMSKPTARPS